MKLTKCKKFSGCKVKNSESNTGVRRQLSPEFECIESMCKTMWKATFAFDGWYIDSLLRTSESHSRPVYWRRKTTILFGTPHCWGHLVLVQSPLTIHTSHQYLEEMHQFEAIFKMFWRLLSNVKTYGRFFQIFVTFSENLNFSSSFLVQMAQEFLIFFPFFCRLIIMEYQTLAILARAGPPVAGLVAAAPTTVACTLVWPHLCIEGHSKM